MLWHMFVICSTFVYICRNICFTYVATYVLICVTYEKRNVKEVSEHMLEQMLQMLQQMYFKK